MLTKEQQRLLKEAWAEQQVLRKTYKTKADAEHNGLTWKTIRDVRLDIYKQVLAELLDNIVAEMDKLVLQSEVKAARIFLDAWFKAVDEGKDGLTYANIALRRAGFTPQHEHRRLGTQRDREVREMEAQILAKIELEMTADEREQVSLSKAHDKRSSK